MLLLEAINKWYEEYYLKEMNYFFNQLSYVVSDKDRRSILPYLPDNVNYSQLSVAMLNFMLHKCVNDSKISFFDLVSDEYVAEEVRRVAEFCLVDADKNELTVEELILMKNLVLGGVSDSE